MVCVTWKSSLFSLLRNWQRYRSKLSMSQTLELIPNPPRKYYEEILEEKRQEQQKIALTAYNKARKTNRKRRKIMSKYSSWSKWKPYGQSTACVLIIYMFIRITIVELLEFHKFLSDFEVQIRINQIVFGPLLCQKIPNWWMKNTLT